MVKLLLDTNALLWAIRSPEKLGPVAKKRIELAPKIWFSAASIFELTLKSQKLGRNGTFLSCERYPDFGGSTDI